MEWPFGNRRKSKKGESKVETSVEYGAFVERKNIDRRHPDGRRVRDKSWTLGFSGKLVVTAVVATGAVVAILQVYLHYSGR